MKHQAADRINKGEKPQHDRGHGQRKAIVHLVIDPLGTKAEGRGQQRPTLALLVAAYLVHQPLHIRKVLARHLLGHVVHRPTHESAFFEGHVARQAVGQGEPLQAGSIGRRRGHIGKDAPSRPRRYAAHQAELLVGLAHGLRVGHGSVGQGFGIESVALRAEEVLQRGIAPLHPQQAAHVGTLHADARLALPVVVVEEPARQHLLGCEAPIRGLATEFHGEILGQRLKGADAVVVIDIEPTEASSRLARQGARQVFGRPHEGRGKQQACHARRSKRRMAKQASEPALRFKEEGQGRKQQEGIARIAEADAPRVAGHGQGDALSVGVVARLIEAVALMAEDAVHGHLALMHFIACGQREAAHEVFRRRCARIMLHPELLQREAEGEGRRLPLGRGKGLHHLALTQVYAPLHAPHMGDQRPQQDEHQGEVKHKSRPTLLHPTTPQITDTRNGHQRPTGHEPGRAIDVAHDKGSAPHLLHTRGGHQYTDKQAQQAEGKISQNFHTRKEFIGKSTALHHKKHCFTHTNSMF